MLLWICVHLQKRDLEGTWQSTLVFFPGESPRTEEPEGLQSIGSHRVGHDWSDLHACTERTISFTAIFLLVGGGDSGIKQGRARDEGFIFFLHLLLIKTLTGAPPSTSSASQIKVYICLGLHGHVLEDMKPSACWVFILLEELGKHLKTIIAKIMKQIAKCTCFVLKGEMIIPNEFYVYKELFGLQPLLVSFSLSSGVCISSFMGKVARHWCPDTHPGFQEAVLASFYRRVSHHFPQHFPAVITPNTQLLLFPKCVLSHYYASCPLTCKLFSFWIAFRIQLCALFSKALSPLPQV